MSVTPMQLIISAGNINVILDQLKPVEDEIKLLEQRLEYLRIKQSLLKEDFVDARTIAVKNILDIQ
jgi:hypothetical protein